MSSEKKAGRWEAGANEHFDNRVVTVFTDKPQRYPIMHASQTDLAGLIGRILDARATWDTHTASDEIQYQIEAAINSVVAPEMLSRAESPSGVPREEERFRQQRENNGLYLTTAWVKPEEPRSETDPCEKQDPLERILFTDGDERAAKCETCNGDREHDCRICRRTHECGDCDGEGKLDAYTDEELDGMPKKHALRRRGGKHVVMYDELLSARSAMAALKAFDQATLEKWFNEPRFEEKTA
jgi:hypothetical protein